MYTVKRIGILSAVKVGAVLSALLVVVPIVVFLILDKIFHFWGIIIPPELLLQSLASAAFWAAVWGGIATGIIAILYNVSARFFGGVEVELHIHQPPRKRNDQVDID